MEPTYPNLTDGNFANIKTTLNIIIVHFCFANSIFKGQVSYSRSNGSGKLGRQLLGNTYPRRVSGDNF